VRSSVKSHLSIRRKIANPARIEWYIMREKWIHMLLYRQVVNNGFSALGMGHLEFVSPEQQDNDIALGRFKHTIRMTDANGDEVLKDNIYDILLKDQDGVRVCVEIKRKAEDTDIGQFSRYLGALQMEADKRGLPDPRMCVITAQIDPGAVCALKPLWRLGVPIELFQLVIKDDGFFLERIQH
jgi:hypothetical protein